MSAFPTVATVIGVSQEVAESGPLLATLAIDPSIMVPPPPPSEPVNIKAGDPVTQAVVDNIIGKLPTKKEPVMLRCETCNITVSSQDILQTHYAGAKHARKLKGQELIKEIVNSPNSTFVTSSGQNGVASKTSEFTCKICNVTVNSYHQLQQHLSGTKHKNKAETNKSNTMQVTIPNCSSGGKGVVNVDIGPNRLYCAACDVHVNSDLQLHQHITSNKHANKVNGRAPSAINNRGSPYTRRQPRSGGNTSNNWATNNKSSDWGSGNSLSNNSSSSNWASNNRNKNVNTGWRPNSSDMGLTGSWPQQTMAPNKPFVSGGMLY